MDISTRKITSKKVRGKNVDFSAIELRSKKVRGSNVDDDDDDDDDDDEHFYSFRFYKVIYLHL